MLGHFKLEFQSLVHAMHACMQCAYIYAELQMFVLQSLNSCGCMNALCMGVWVLVYTHTRFGHILHQNTNPQSCLARKY